MWSPGRQPRKYRICYVLYQFWIKVKSLIYIDVKEVRTDKAVKNMLFSFLIRDKLLVVIFDTMQHSQGGIYHAHAKSGEMEEWFIGKSSIFGICFLYDNF